MNAQVVDSKNLQLTIVPDSVEIHDGDSTFYSSYEHVSNKHLREGIKLGNAGNYEKAISEFDAALKFDKKNSEVYFNRGLAYFFLKINNMAITDFNRAIEINENYFLAYVQRGVTYYKIGNYVKAIEDFKEIIKLKPNESVGYLNLGTSYLNINKREEACINLKKAKDLGEKGAADLFSKFCQ